MDYRIERDSMGEVRVPADRLWGAQTQRSLENFRIGTERMPREVHEALLLIKRAAARVNASLGYLSGAVANAIIRAEDEDMAAETRQYPPSMIEFPLAHHCDECSSGMASEKTSVGEEPTRLCGDRKSNV